MQDNLYKQHSQSTQLIQKITEEITSVKEIGRQTQSFAQQLQNLQDVLQNSKQRGGLGEYHLEMVLENVLPPGLFQMQYMFENGEIVDAIVRVDKKIVPIDSKFPLENYHRMLEIGAGEHDRRSAQQAFRADVRRHVDAIAGKYILPGITSDGAVMFLPAEGVFAEVHAYHPEVVAYAQQKRVWIVSPTTLMAVLNTARAVLKDVETRKQIHVIKDALGKLAKDFQRFDERMAALARHIEQASRDVQDVQTSSRKISAHFHKIESARLDELDELDERGEPEQEPDAAARLQT